VFAVSQVVPAHSSKYISIIFDVRSLTIPPEGLDCQTIGLSYMTLPDSRLDNDGWIYRQHQYDMPPLRVVMTGHVMRAEFNVEFCEDDGMKYVILASDLLDDDNQVIILQLNDWIE